MPCPAVNDSNRNRPQKMNKVMFVVGGKLTINGEHITASWAYCSERYQRWANYIRVHFFYYQIHATVADTCMLTIVFDNSITSSYLGKMYSNP